MEKLNKRNETWEIPVKEVFGSLKPSIFGSGRKKSELESVSFDKLKQYVQFCKKNGIEFNYTLNFSCNSNMELTRKGRDKIIKFARKLNAIGIRRFTAVLPPVIQILDEFVPEAKVTVSVISDVDSLTRLKSFLSTKNVDRIYVPEFMNRKTSQLKKLASHGKELECEFGTIVNTTCLVDCPYRNFHYPSSSHDLEGRDILSKEYYVARCNTTLLENPVEWLKSPWIRPENIRDYIRLGISWFKISGREHRNADFIKVVDIYNEGSFDGNLLEFLMCFSESTFKNVFNMQNKNLDKFAQRFLENTVSCTTKDCETCNYCYSNSNLVSVDKLSPAYNSWKEVFLKECSRLIEK